MVEDAEDYTGRSDIRNVFGDVKIYTPSGLWVVGSDIITARMRTGFIAPGGGKEEVIMSATGRGRIRQIGLWLNTLGVIAGKADVVNNAVIRIYLDADVDAGIPTISMYVYDLDLLNGGELEVRRSQKWYDDTVTIDTTVYERYWIKHVSPRGGVTLALYNRADLRYYVSTSWFVPDCEYLEKCKITLYNDNPNPGNYLFGQACVLYGMYP